MRIGDKEIELGIEEAWALYLASLAGVAELGFQLERLEQSPRGDCLEDARRLRPALLAEVERQRRGP